MILDDWVYVLFLLVGGGILVAGFQFGSELIEEDFTDVVQVDSSIFQASLGQ